MKLFPKHTTNRNVPRNVFLVVENTKMSGEIKTTFYIDKAGYVSYVDDWKGDKPHPATYVDLDIITDGKGAETIKRFDAWMVRLKRRYK